jgi:hypothetical protein
MPGRGCGHGRVQEASIGPVCRSPSVKPKAPLSNTAWIAAEGHANLSGPWAKHPEAF